MPAFRSSLFASALAALFFAPTGVFAVYYSSKAIEAANAGDHFQAERSARQARTLMIITWVLAGILGILGLLYQFFAISVGAGS